MGAISFLRSNLIYTCFFQVSSTLSLCLHFLVYNQLRAGIDNDKERRLFKEILESILLANTIQVRTSKNPRIRQKSQGNKPSVAL